MKIVSFAWTTPALLRGDKTVTRRFWDDTYASHFHAGDLVAAWDRSPRAKRRKGQDPKHVATIRLTRDPYKQSVYDMTEEDEQKEGGLWGSAAAFQEAMVAQGKGHVPWVIEFEVVSVEPAAEPAQEPKLFA